MALDILTQRGLALPVRSVRLPWVLFTTVVVLYPTYQLLTRGRLFLSGSMWAETATNYYATASSGDLLQQLFGTDAGYIPLPQRLLALVGQSIGISLQSVPYFYSGIGFLISGVLIATVCLACFRPVIASDGLRFVLALAVLLLTDFETRTFINFTYFAVIPLVAVTALAASRPRSAVPAWAWVLPVFMLSKPGVLAVLPAMVVVAVLVGGTRFRRLTAAAVGLALVQLVQLAVSSGSGSSLLQASDQTLLSKAFTAVKYTLGLLGRLVLGPSNTWGVYPWMFTGIAVLVLAAGILVVTRSRVGPLVLIGASLVFFTMALDVFSFPVSFSRDMTLLSTAGFDRRFIVAVFGALFMVSGVISAVSDSSVTLPSEIRRGSTVARSVGTLALVAWFVGGGWLDYAAAVNRPFGVPVGDVSQWEAQSPRLADATEPTVCIPLDPFRWMYGRNCQVLVDDKVIPFVLGWSALTPITSSRDPASPAPSAEDPVEGADNGSEDVVLDLPVPEEVTRGTLASLGLLVRPDPGTTGVVARAVLTARDGTETVLAAEADLGRDGGMLQFTSLPTAAADDVIAVTVVFDGPVSVAATDPVAGTQTTVVMWMGLP